MEEYVFLCGVGITFPFIPWITDKWDKSTTTFEDIQNRLNLMKQEYWKDYSVGPFDVSYMRIIAVCKANVPLNLFFLVSDKTSIPEGVITFDTIEEFKEWLIQ
jgi:hypothetical protein